MKKTSSGWGFDTRTIDAKTRPQDDFFKYANGSWLKATEIPATESRWGAFSTLRHTTDKQLNVILKEVTAKKRVTKGSADQMVRDFYRSGMDLKRRNALGVSPLKKLRGSVASVATKEELRALIPELHKIGIDIFWGVGIDQDSKKSDRYMMHLFQGGIGMPDRDYYLKDAPEQKRVRTAYKHYVEALVKKAGASSGEATKALKTVMSIETALAKASMPKEETRDCDKVYNKMSLRVLKGLSPRTDWQSYFKEIDAGSPKEVIVMQPDFMKAVDALIEGQDLDDLKAYVDFHIVDEFAGYLSSSFVKLAFAFYGQTLTGTKKMKPLWRQVLAVVNGNLGELVGQIYVRKHFSESSKKKVESIVDDLFSAYAARIRNLDWMSPATKRKALVKLGKMNRKLAYPDKWKSFKSLAISADDYVGNVIRTTLYEHKRYMKRLYGPVDRGEWFMYPQTVNAYCSFNLNEVVFPAAFLQFPFFDPSADDAINYGALGMTIGHEITHAFDDQGAKFDGDGNMRTWWTAEDKKRFESKGKVVEKQFSAFSVAPGLNVNGKLTLGENIADLGGLSIAYDAYMLRLEKTGRKDIAGFTPEQRFFLGYAQAEREKARPAFVRTCVLTDPHSPAEFRVNGPVANMPEFYEAFNVTKKDKLYRSPSVRAKIW